MAFTSAQLLVGGLGLSRTQYNSVERDMYLCALFPCQRIDPFVKDMDKLENFQILLLFQIKYINLQINNIP